jgi:hypothetical protein
MLSAPVNPVPAMNTPFAFQFKPVRQPLLWAAVAYSLGIAAGVYLWRPVLWLAVGALALGMAAAYFAQRRVWLGRGLVLGAVFLTGAMHVQVRGASAHLDTRVQEFADGREVHITAHVIRDGKFRPGSYGETRQAVDVETEEVATEVAAGASSFRHPPQYLCATHEGSVGRR